MTAAQTKPTGNPRNFIEGTMTDNAAGGDYITLNGLLTHGSIAIQLSGTWTGTVSFEATVNGSTWVALNLFPSNSGTAASSATANGAWGDVMHGWKGVRGRCTAAMTGTVTISISALQGQF